MPQKDTFSVLATRVISPQGDRWLDSDTAVRITFGNVGFIVLPSSAAAAGGFGGATGGDTVIRLLTGDQKGVIIVSPTTRAAFATGASATVLTSATSLT